MKQSWNDITIKDLMLIRDIDSMQMATEDEKNLKVAAIIAEMPYEQLIQIPLNDVKTYMDAASFLLEKPEPVKHKRKYEINGREYKLFKDPSEMTVAQYIDFQAIYQDGFDKRPAELLSIMLIPKGHTYNDGYDKEEAINDMYDLSVVEGLGICDFFMKRYIRSIKWALMYCKVMMWWAKLTARKENKEMVTALEIQMRLITENLNCIFGSPVFKL